MAGTITTFLFILILAIVFSSAVYATLQAPSSSPPILTCTEELVMFSPCLSYVSAPPNNMSETPNPICCSVFTSSVHSSAGNCLCYLLRQPMILGFPLDRSRLLSLSQICTDKSSDESFESLCSLSGLISISSIQLNRLNRIVDVWFLRIWSVVQSRRNFRRFRVSSSQIRLFPVRNGSFRWILLSFVDMSELHSFIYCRWSRICFSSIGRVSSGNFTELRSIPTRNSYRITTTTTTSSTIHLKRLSKDQKLLVSIDHHHDFGHFYPRTHVNDMKLSVITYCLGLLHWYKDFTIGRELKSFLCWVCSAAWLLLLMRLCQLWVVFPWTKMI